MDDGDFLSQLGAAQAQDSPSPVAPNAPSSGDFLSQLGSAQSQDASAPPVDTRNPLAAAVEDIPSEIGNAASDAWSSISSNLNPISDVNRARNEKAAKTPFWSGLADQAQGDLAVGSGLAAIPSLVASPLTGASRSIIGHGLQATGDTYEGGKAEADKLMMALAPKGDGLPGRLPANLPAPAVADIPPSPTSGPFGVMLSEGQKSGSLPEIQAEQSALSGRMGGKAQSIAQTFSDQQKGQVAAAHNQVATSFDPNGQMIADTPQQAGQMLSQSVQSAAKNAKGDVNAAYTTARGLPGEIDAGAFTGIGDSIKNDLTNRQEPVIVDDKLTPYASAAINDIDQNVSKLNIPNKADPDAAPNPADIVGVSLNGIDQWRKRLSAYRTQAFASGNASDGRAVSAVLDSFDNHVDDAVNSGKFSGDPDAVNAWNTARAANADYRSTFTPQGKDPVGRVVDKITGGSTGSPAIGNDVADYLYGASGVNPSSLNVGVANRVQKIFGPQSPQWSAVKQGLFSRMTETPPGVTDWGPTRIAQNINKFLNGDGVEMANAVYTSPEREMLQNYADLMRTLEVPPAARNASQTSTFVVPALRFIGKKVGVVGGAILGHFLLPDIGPLAEGIGAGAASGMNKVADMVEARKIAKQMPVLSSAMKQWQKAVAQASGSKNIPTSQNALRFATANLARQLAPFGVSIHDVMAQIPGMQSPGTSNAQENQQNIPGPPAQQPVNGNISQQQPFAKGGSVSGKDYPAKRMTLEERREAKSSQFQSSP